MVAAALSGCAGFFGGAAYEPFETRPLDGSVQDVFDAAKRAVVGLGLTIEAEDASSWTLVASKGPGGDFVSRKVKVTLQGLGPDKTQAGVESETWSSSPFFSARREGYNRTVLYEIGAELKVSP
jgi:hypothetical protein